MKRAWFCAGLFLLIALAVHLHVQADTPPDAAAPAPPPAVRFGISGSAEWADQYPQLFPLLHDAGIGAIRQWPEWPAFQSAPGQWDFTQGDALVDSARKNHIELLGLFLFLSHFASANGDTRTFPIKDMQYWRDYVTGLATHYQKDVRYWEVWNEWNGGFQNHGTIQDYANLIREAYTQAKKVDPKIQIGFGCADVDASFLERVIQAGAADHFDFITVHPYSLLGAVMGGREAVFLRMGENLRKILERNHQRKDLPIWVTEMGQSTPSEAGSEASQAEALVKGYTLCFAVGVQRVYWFEGRGPDYGKGRDFGIIRKDWTKRPSYTALQTLTTTLGAQPSYLGWTTPTGKSYGFVFQGPTKPVLITWANNDQGDTLTFPQPVTVTDISGQTSTLAAGQTLKLTRTPTYVTDLPDTLVADAKTHADKPYPLADFSTADSVACTMGQANVTSGLTQLEQGDGLTATGLVDGLYARRTDMARNMNYMYFDVDDSYASVGDNDIEITLTARRVDPDKPVQVNLTYESKTGYHGDERWLIPADDAWHTQTFKVLKDANFANNWGWNFRFETGGSAGDMWVKDVTVKRIGPKK